MIPGSHMKQDLTSASQGSPEQAFHWQSILQYKAWLYAPKICYNKSDQWQVYIRHFIHRHLKETIVAKSKKPYLQLLWDHNEPWWLGKMCNRSITKWGRSITHQMIGDFDHVINQQTGYILGGPNIHGLCIWLQKYANT